MHCGVETETGDLYSFRAVVNPVRLTHGNIGCTLDVISPFKGACFQEIFCLKGRCSFIGVFGGSEEFTHKESDVFVFVLRGRTLKEGSDSAYIADHTNH